MGELIRRERAANPIGFSGERLTSGSSGQLEVEHYHRYLLAREFCRGRDVIDVAAGEGYGTALLAQVARSAIGVEIDQAAVDAARTEFPRPNLRFEQGDARAIPLPDASIDVAVSFETLEHIAEQPRFLAELRRILRPDGLLILSTPDRDIYSPVDQAPNPYHAQELTRPEFEHLVRQHFPHAAFVAQRAFIGSAIIGAPEPDPEPFQTYERRGEDVIEGSRQLARAPYLIAFASAAPLPPIPASLYVYRTDLETDAQERQRLTDELGETRQALVHANGYRAEANRRRQEAEAIMDAVNAEAARAEAARAEIQRTLDGLADIRQRAESAEARLLAIHASPLWRAAGPLRRAARRWPRAARRARQALRIAYWAVTLQLPTRYALWRTNQLRALGVIGPPLPGAAPTAALPAPKPIVIPSSPEGTTPEISIIICGYGQVAATLACLRTIATHPPTRPFEVLLVDDAYPGPEDLTPLTRIPGVQHLRNTINLGFLRSANHAAAAARGTYLYFLNNDTELFSRAIETLAELLDTRPDAALVGSKLIYPDGRLQEAGGILWTDASGWNYGRFDAHSRPEYNYVREVDYASGASIMVRRAVWESLGGFDDAFAPAYYEDTDLAFRIRAAGHRVLYEPRSLVIHHEGTSHGTDESTGLKAHQATNRARMRERWAAVLDRDHYPNATHILRARDRARHRRTILVIDHYTPEPDRDAGSRTMLAVLERLVEASWVVKFWPAGRQYSDRYTPPLEAQGIEVLDNRYPADLDTWLAQNGPDLDHIMVSRPDIAADVMHRLMRDTARSTFSFYGHDLHCARLRLQAAVDGDPALLEAADRMEQIERRVWRNFDVNIYLSEDEARTVRTMAPGTPTAAVIPYSFPITPMRRAVPENGGVLFVAGFNHPPNVDAALFLVNEVLPALERLRGPTRVTLAGSKPSDAVLALAGPRMDVTGWIPDDDLAQLYLDSRVAIVPLRFGAGVKGKVVEALSHGLPLVTTAVGAQGIDGLSDLVPVHDDAPGLAAALARLISDDAAWLAQSQAQTEFAQARFSREAMRTSITTILLDAEHRRIGKPA